MAASPDTASVAWLCHRLRHTETDRHLLPLILADLAETLLDTPRAATTGSHATTVNHDPDDRHDAFRPYRWFTDIGTVELDLRTANGHDPTWLLETPDAPRLLVQLIAEAYLTDSPAISIDALLRPLENHPRYHHLRAFASAALETPLRRWCHRPLHRAYSTLWLESFTRCTPDGTQCGRAAAVHAIGATPCGRLETLGASLLTEDHPLVWLDFLSSLRARGLAGLRWVFAPAHHGLQEALVHTLPSAHLRQT